MTSMIQLDLDDDKLEISDYWASAMTWHNSKQLRLGTWHIKVIYWNFLSEYKTNLAGPHDFSPFPHKTR